MTGRGVTSAVMLYNTGAQARHSTRHAEGGGPSIDGGEQGMEISIPIIKENRKTEKSVSDMHNLINLTAN